MPKRKKSTGAAKRMKMSQLSREIKYGSGNISKLKSQWTQLCSKIALSKLKEEFLSTWHTFEKIMDAKDFIISLYMDQIEEDEDEVMNTFVNIQDKIEIIMEEFFIKLRDLHLDFEEKFQNLVRSRLQDFERQKAAAENEENMIRVIAFKLELESNSTDNFAKTEAFGMMNEYTTKSSEHITALTLDSKEKLKDIWNRMKKSHDLFVQHTRGHKAEYKTLKKTDDANRKILRKEAHKLRDLFHRVISQNHDLKELKTTIGQRLEYLQSEKNYLHECCFALKNSLKKDKDYDTIKRTLITVEFMKIDEFLQAKLRKGEMMMKGMRIAHRYETSQDKILPFPLRGRTKEVQLKLFWQRVAQVEASRYALNEERVYLLTENKKLQRKIHEHCQCLDCPSLPPIPIRKGTIPYIEGREMMRKISIQNYIKRESLIEQAKNKEFERKSIKSLQKVAEAMESEKEVSDMFDLTKLNSEENVLTK